MLRPAAQPAIGAGHGSGFLWCSHKILKPLARRPRIGAVILQAQRGTFASAQLHMGKFRHHPLDFRQQVGIEHQLQHMFWVRRAFQLGIGHFIAEIPQL